MTTLVGIKSNEGIEGIVFAADLQGTYFDDEGIPEQKSRSKKIISGKGWMLADSGAEYKEYRDFERLLKGKNEKYTEDAVTALIKRAVQRFKQGGRYQGTHFPEINALNGMLRRKDRDYNDLHELLLAVNTPKLGLWKVDEFGNLKKASGSKVLEYYILGSGGKYAKEYIKRQVAQQRVHHSQITLTKAIDLAFGALRYAQRDVYSSGFDMVVMTEKEIIPYGNFIQKSLTKALGAEIKKIKDNYKI